LLLFKSIRCNHLQKTPRFRGTVHTFVPFSVLASGP
jgi:hypothetical protein